MRRSVLIGVSICALGCAGENSAPARLVDADTVHMSVAWEVAPGIHPSADSLGEVSGIAIDGSGNVYASDFLAARVWIFDDEGRFRLGFGGKGEGPGEFQAPTGPAVGPDGRLYVRDVARVSVFGPDSITGLLSRFEDSFEGPAYPDWTSMRSTRFDTAGALLYPGKRWLEDGTATSFLVRFTPSGLVEDTIFVPKYATDAQLTAYVQTGPSGGKMLPGLNHVPFAPLSVWDVTSDGTIVSGDGRSYDLVEDRGGGAVTTFHRDAPLERIPQDEHRDSIGALRDRLDSLLVPLDRVKGMPEEVRSLEVPETYPAYMAVYAGLDGAIWVRRWSVGGRDQTVFDLFSSEGEYERTVILPRAIQVEPTPALSDAGVVGVTTNPLTGESIILRFRP